MSVHRALLVLCALPIYEVSCRVQGSNTLFKIRVPYVATGDNLADFLTKAQHPDLFFEMRNKIMNIPPDASSTGGR